MPERPRLLFYIEDYSSQEVPDENKAPGETGERRDAREKKAKGIVIEKVRRWSDTGAGGNLIERERSCGGWWKNVLLVCLYIYINA